MENQIKSRFYRHPDPRRGFQLSHYDALHSYLHKQSTQNLIYSINSQFNKYSDEQSQILLDNPSGQQIIKLITILLCLPLVLSVLMDNYDYMLVGYLIAFAVLFYRLNSYLKLLTQNKYKFDLADKHLKDKLNYIINQINQKCSYLKMSYYQKYNSDDQQYIEMILNLQQINQMQLQSCSS